MDHELVYEDGEVIAAFTKDHNNHSRYGYLTILKEIEEIARDNDLRVGSLPMLLKVFNENSELRETIRQCGSINRGRINSTSSEYHGQRDGKDSYELLHDVGPLSGSEGVEAALQDRRGKHGFMPIDKIHWEDIGNGKYLGQDVARVHLDDVRKGGVPSPGTPYSIFVGMEEDCSIHKNLYLSYDQFMTDDRMLMIAGSPENREKFAGIVFPELQNRRRHAGVSNNGRTDSAGFEAVAKGRPVLIRWNNSLAGYVDLSYNGNFFAISDKLLEATSPPETNVELTLEQTLETYRNQTLAIVRDPGLDREDMARAIEELYGR